MTPNDTKTSETIKNIFNKLDPHLTRAFLPWALRNPRYLRTFSRLAKVYRQTNEFRKKQRESDIMVPPFLILSITQNCNLYCSGCFAAATGTLNNHGNGNNNNTKQLELDQWKKIISEASKLGVFGFVIAGGEPFLYPNLLNLCEEFKDRFFIILTNGTTLNEDHYKRLKKLGNVAILVSVEGGSRLTDSRRGIGVYSKAINTVKHLNKLGVLNGISVTITRMNYKYWMEPENINDLISQGIRIGVFIEYIPLTPATATDVSKQFAAYCSGINEDFWSEKNDYALMLSEEERKLFRDYILGIRRTKQIYLIHSPGDEEYFGGCVSAGRGFAHITPAGDLTPCPISTVATHNLTRSSLRDGLKSPLFSEIRANEHLLENDGTPCALFAHPKEVEQLAKAVGAYRTDL